MIDYKKLHSGIYEVERITNCNEYLLTNANHNILNPLGLIYIPVVDEQFLNMGGKKPVWPGNKRFAVCLTHDVHNVTLFSQQISRRKLISRLTQAKSPIDLIRRPLGFFFELFHLFKNLYQPDPLHCFEKWLEMESIVNARSTFFFWPGLKSIRKRHSTDCFYELSDNLVFDGQNCSVNEMEL